MEVSSKILYAFLAVYIIILLIISILIQRYFVRKNTNIFINIFCVFIWFTTLFMIIIFPFDLFQDTLFENSKNSKGKAKLFSELFYWNFYICGFLIVDNLKAYLMNGNFTFTTKLISTIKGMAIFLTIFLGFGFVLKLLLQLINYIAGDPKGNNFLSMAIKIIQTVIGMPMLIAYLMFLGCSLGDIPRDLYSKYNYKLRNRRLCWDITHVMRKYKKETEFIILSINKIKMTQEKIKNTTEEEINNEIKNAKDIMDQENNEEEKKSKKNVYENLKGLKNLYNCEREMNETLQKLENTAKIFNLNIPLDTIDKPDEKRVLKNKDELVDIHATYKVYCTQIYRINYQKYAIYKEWAEIKSFLLLGLDEEISSNITNSETNAIITNDINIDINEQNTKEKNNINNFQKIKLTEKQILYYKHMPKISYVLIALTIIYGVFIIIGQFEYTFGWDAITGPILRWLFMNPWVITPIRLFPIYYTFFSVSYSFTSIKSDMTFCVYGNRQTEPCFMLFFVGMLAKFICPLCYNFIEIIFNSDYKKKNDVNFDNLEYQSKIILYLEEQFGFLKDDNVVIFISKIAFLFLFIKAIICNITGCYGNTAYKKNQYLSYNAKYLEKEMEILEGEDILIDMNKKYGNNFEQLKNDFIFE